MYEVTLIRNSKLVSRCRNSKDGKHWTQQSNVDGGISMKVESLEVDLFQQMCLDEEVKDQDTIKD